MVNRNYWMFTAILVGLCSVALLFGGVVAGFRHEGLQMGLCFFLAVHAAYCCVACLLNVKIDNCFKRLGIRRMKARTGVASVLMVGVWSALITLSILAALRRYWLLMCVLLSAYAVAHFICDGVLIARKADDCIKRLEELIAGEALKGSCRNL